MLLQRLKKKEKKKKIKMLPLFYYSVRGKCHIGRGGKKRPTSLQILERSKQPDQLSRVVLEYTARVIPEPHSVFRVKCCLDYNTQLGLT